MTPNDEFGRKPFGTQSSPFEVLVRTMAASMPARVAAATVAIVGSCAGVVRHLGTGTLLTVADMKFVVTAAHVLHKAKEQDLTVAISPASGGVFTALTARTWMATSARGVDDEHDIALYPLDVLELGRLGATDSIRIADVCFERDLSVAYFVVCGFPGMWSTTSHSDGVDMKSKLLQYGTYSFIGSVSGLRGFDPDRHILLDGTPGDMRNHHGEPTRFKTRSGYPASMPGALAGISGCSVWRIGDFRTPTSEWNVDGARIVGVQTGVYESAGAIKATRWHSVAILLYAAYPDLRSTINLYADI